MSTGTVNWVDRVSREKIVDVAQRLVSIPSVSGDELDVMTFVQRWLDERGIGYVVTANDPARPNVIATVGEVGNAEQGNINWGKAGRMRWKGKRPTVRGVAMNPIDHPHGGGEGKTSGGRHPVSPWGKPEGRTRRPKKASDKLIIRRRKTNKKR